MDAWNRNLGGVKKVLSIYAPQNQMQANGITLSRAKATGNLEWYSSMLALHYTQGSMKEQAISAFAGERAVLLSRYRTHRPRGRRYAGVDKRRRELRLFGSGQL